MSQVTHGIRSIRIENFRGIDKLDLSFEMPNGDVSDIVVVAGPNGCGKTTVLEACLHFTSACNEIVGPTWKTGHRVGSTHYRLSCVLGPPFDRRPCNYDSRNDRADTVTLSRDTYTYLTDTSGRPIGVDTFAALYVPSFRSPKLSGALPVVSGPTVSGRPEPGENRYLWVKQYLIAAMVFEVFGGSSINAERTSRHLTRRLTDAWSKFYPDDDGRFEVQMAGNGPTGGADLYLVTPAGRIPTDHLSSGQLEIVGILGTLIALEQPVHVLVIDEPELHLDPQWHVPLLNAIRSVLPDTQVIVGTHSPRIYDSVYSFQRHFLIPDDDPRSAAWQPAEAATP